MKKLTTFILAIILSFQFITPVQALTIELSNTGNSSNSTSTVSYEATTKTTVTQQNDSTINNQTAQTANTGDNNCSDNSGDCNIETGNIDSQTSVKNQAGYNQVNIDQSREHAIDTKNSGNGDNSDNSIDTETTIGLNLTQENQTDIQNTSDKKLNTGDNNATNNGGDAAIKTGNIYDESTIYNNSGKNDAQIGAPGPVKIIANNSENGRKSNNQISAKWSDEENIDQRNDTKIDNQEDKDLNTGNNHCNNNSGDCEIVTGDINSRTKVKNNAGENDLEKNIRQPSPTITPTPTKGQERPTPKATPTPGAVQPTPTEAPKGGPVEPSPTPTKELKVTPTPTEKPGIVESGEEKPQEEKPIQEKIKEAIRKLVPEIQAAEKQEKEEPQVLGATMLPVTGIGYNGMGMPLGDIIFGLSLITGGLFIRRGTSKPKDCEAPLR